MEQEIPSIKLLDDSLLAGMYRVILGRSRVTFTRLERTPPQPESTPAQVLGNHGILGEDGWDETTNGDFNALAGHDAHR